jgi:hypothetical protein
MADDGKDHGDDHDPKDDGFDPWADLDAEGSSEPGEGFSFSVDDIGLDAGLDAGLDVPPADASADNVTADEAFLAEGPHDSEFVAAEEEVVVDRPAEEPAEDDAFVNAWLTETDEEPAAATPLSVFSPDDHGDLGEIEGDAAEPAWPHDPAAIEIGTGQSGVTSASDIEAIGFGEEPVAEDANAEPVEADIIDFGAAAGAAAVATAAAAGGASEPLPAPGPSVAAKPRSRSGLGQLIGVLLGGLMAIPVVLGILIGLMWMGWKDTVGIRQWWPQQAAFLLPPAGTRLGASGGPNLAGAPSLDDLPAADATAVVTDEPPSAPAATEPTADETTPVVTAEPVAGEPAPMPEPLAAVPAEPAPPPMLDPVSPPVAVDEPPAPAAPAPALDALAAVAPPQPAPLPATVPSPEPPPVAVVAEPEPLDLGSLEAAVADATAAFDAVQAVVDPSDPARRTLLVDWYKQLARVAQELAMLERVAADSGRPLPETPAVAAALGGRVLAAPQLADDLARLARNWLTYSRRDGDGVVMPATFSSARRVGPYWCSRVVIAEAGGASRELSVISRQEPAAVPGDAVVIMGLVMDGGVLWASDVRTAAAIAPAAAVEPDPFGQPGL